ncbi:hypothetical protein [Castellaniella sp.]|uniref:hypothetical protein n=1 Tax=Castellaniella sp. TaxID=1955812 RepID=UPI003C781401
MHGVIRYDEGIDCKVAAAFTDQTPALATNMIDYESEFLESLIIHPPSEGHGIGFSDFEITYQTRYKNSYANQLIHDYRALEVTLMSHAMSQMRYSLDCLRVFRVLRSVQAIIWKYSDLQVSTTKGVRGLIDHNVFVVINETSSLLYAIRRTVEFILQIHTNNENLSIGCVLKKSKENKDTNVGKLVLDRSTLLLFKTINLITNALKHSLLNEDTNPMLGISYDRFFATENLSIEEFSKKFNPKKGEMFFYWDAESIDDIQIILNKIKDTVRLEYNVSISQVIISFFVFMKKYTDMASDALIQSK